MSPKLRGKVNALFNSTQEQQLEELAHLHVRYKHEFKIWLIIVFIQVPISTF